ncbi:MAG: tetratricopeptide repeat protein [Candidatus Omnitrophica bacterium]|nr:tetratricopeptide repeat protein [Candidatus Omnitrophota bacterium]
MRRAIKYLLMLMLFIVPLIFSKATTEVYGLVKITMIELCSLVLAVLWLIYRGFSVRFARSNILSFAVLFFAIGCVSLIKAVNMQQGLQALYLLAANIILFLVIFGNTETIDDARKLGITAILAGVVASIFCVYQNKGLSMSILRLNYTSTFGNPIFFSEYISAMVPLSFGMSMQKGSALWKRLTYIFAGIFMLVMLIFIRSIGAYLSLFAAFLYIGINFMPVILKKNKKIMFGGFIFLIVVILALGAIFWPKAQAYLKNRQLQNLMRVHVWAGSLNIIKAHPVSGVGIGNFEYAYPLYRTEKEKEVTPKGIKYTKAHNEFLQVWSEMGILGFLAFLGIIFFIFSFPAGGSAFIIGIRAALIALLTQALFNPMLTVPTSGLLFWSLLGILAFLGKNQNKIADKKLNDKGVNFFERAGTGVLCAALLGFGGPAAVRPFIGDYFFEKAQIAESKSDTTAAVSNLKNSLKAYPHNWEALFLLGNIEQRMSAYNEAVDKYEKALKYHPYSALIWNNLGTVYMRIGKVDKTIDAFKRIMEIDRQNIGAYYNLAVVYRNNGQEELAKKEMDSLSAINPTFFGNMYVESGIFNQAMVEFHKVIGRDPGNIEAHFMLGEIYKKQGETDKAIEMYKRTVEMSPAHVEANIALGEIYKDRAEMDKAIMYYDQALNVIPESTDRLARDISFYSDLGFFGQVLKEYEKVKKLEESRIDVSKKLGVIYKSKGQPEKAMEIYEGLNKVLALDVTILKDLAEIYEDLGMYKDAADLYVEISGIDFRQKEALQKKILLLNRIAAHHAMAKIYEDQSMEEKAVDEYKKVLDFYPKDIFTLRQMGRAYVNSGSFEKAEDVYKNILEIAPNNAETRVVFGDALFQAGRAADAEQQYLKATEIAANDIRAFFALGRLYRKENRLGEAELIYKKAIEFSPQNVQLHFAIASLKEDVGDFEGAVSEYERVLSIDPQNKEAKIRLEVLKK